MSNIEEMTVEAAQEKARVLMQRINNKILEFPPAEGFDTYKPKETDIVVTTFPKSGTTLTQQLTYQVVIATGGAGEKDPDGMTFDDVCEVVPYVDFGPKHGFPDYESNPRIYKSHSTPTMFKDTIQKHLVVIRNPKSTPASALDFFFEAWAGEKVTNTLVLEKVYREFLAQRLLGRGAGFGSDSKDEKKVLYFQKEEKKDENEEGVTVGPWFLHTKGWMKAMRPNTLFMFYEDIVADMGNAAKRIAKFMGRDLDEAGVKQVLQRCDRDYMANDKKFKCTLENKALGFGEFAWKAKPKDMQGFTFKQFKPTKEEEEEIRARFQQAFGCETYEQLKEIINAKQKEMGIDF